ncbi:MAG: hypothetical protein HZB30_06675 [Nitrospirae bacterium]|nr:hypothetical protein [Nitrospirota bacterium]
MEIREKGIAKVSVFFMFVVFLLITSLVSAQTYDQTKDPYTFGGKVGIGTLSPSALIDIKMSTNPGAGASTTPGFLIQSIGQNAPALAFKGSSSDSGTGDGYGIGKIVYDSDNERFNFWHGGFGLPTGQQIIWDGVSEPNNISVPTRGNAVFHFNTSINLETKSDNTGKVIIPNGNVGIGTTTPSEKMHIYGNANTFLHIEGGPSTISNGIKMTTNGNIMFVSNENGRMGFFNTSSERMSILNNGNVGIGTTTPSKKLHVAGDIQVDGNINAKYQDLAEWVRTSESLTKGMVVMIDTKEVNQVVPSDKAYNTLVAGVVSETPGIILGEGGADKAIIAHTGRVKVKVDTSNGEISVGDLLVASPVKGYAMKADSDKLKPGMLLGKALEPLKEGQQGEILALITLQ